MNEIAIKTESQSLITRAEKIAENIVDESTCKVAFNEQQRLKEFRKSTISPFFEPMRKKAYDAYQEIQKKMKAFIDPIEKAECLLGVKIGTFEAKRRAEIEAERRRKMEEMQKKQKAAEEKIAKAKTPMQKQKAEVHLENTLSEPLPVASNKNGITVRTYWSASVTNMEKLIKAIAEGKAPLQAIQPNSTFLNAQSKAFKKEGEILPGVMAIKTIKS